MLGISNKEYFEKLKRHFENYFKIKGQKITWNKGPHEKLHPEFYILEFSPNQIHEFWIYCTIGMSADYSEENLVELFIFSPRQEVTIAELLTITASYHRNVLPLNLHHTVNIGQPWLDNSKCGYGFISLPYLDGEELEIAQIAEKTVNCYWLIPITEKERNYKIDHGVEALEQLFEEKQLDYLNPERSDLTEA